VDGFSGDEGPATAAQMNAPAGIVPDKEGRNLYAAEQQNNRVRRITLPPARVKIINNQSRTPKQFLLSRDHLSCEKIFRRWCRNRRRYFAGLKEVPPYQQKKSCSEATTFFNTVK